MKSHIDSLKRFIELLGVSGSRTIAYQSDCAPIAVEYGTVVRLATHCAMDVRENRNSTRQNTCSAVYDLCNPVKLALVTGRALFEITLPSFVPPAPVALAIFWYLFIFSLIY